MILERPGGQRAQGEVGSFCCGPVQVDIIRYLPDRQIEIGHVAVWKLEIEIVSDCEILFSYFKGNYAITNSTNPRT